MRTNRTDTAAPFDKPHRMIDVGHARVPHWQFGEGPDLFFVHGWPLTGATFRDLMPTLSRHFRCHIIDLPGAGQSVWSAESHIGMAEHAKTVIEVIDTLALKDYALVGHDSGAAICRAVAARHGARVRGLVMGNTEVPGHIPFMLRVFIALAKIPGGSALLRPALRYRWLRQSSLGFKSCFNDTSLANGPFKTLFLDPLLASKQAFAGQMRLAKNLDLGLVKALDKVHALIQAPVFMIWGKNDGWFPLRRARGMLDQFPGGAELVELPGKLLVHEERPAEFADLAEGFFLRAFKG